MGKGPGGAHANMKTYSPEEAELVLRLVEAHSPRWTHIAKLVSEATNSERTAASVRNYYKRFCASRQIATCQSDVRKLNRCQICGQIKRGHICQREYVTPATCPALPPPSEEAVQGLRLLAGVRDEPLLPVAAASLEVVTHSPMSDYTLAGGPFSTSSLSTLGSPPAPGVGTDYYVFARPPTAIFVDAAAARLDEVQECEEDDGAEGESTDGGSDLPVCDVVEVATY